MAPVQHPARLLALPIPKLREASCFPSFPEARRLSEKALNVFIQEAWINDVSIRKADALIPQTGMTGLFRSLGASVYRSTA